VIVVEEAELHVAALRAIRRLDAGAHRLHVGHRVDRDGAIDRALGGDPQVAGGERDVVRGLR
jgi:hypothetical protein